MIEFDVETTGLQAYGAGNEAFLWIFYDGTAAEAIPFSPTGSEIPGWGTTGDEDAKQRIQAWFDKAADDPDGIRAWNTKFDRAFAERAGCFALPGDGRWHDGMVVAHAVDERRSVALKSVAAQLFGDEATDPQKALKEWLNTENRRRAKVLTDAEKAKVGTLKIKDWQVKCPKCKTVWDDEHPDGTPTCATCGTAAKFNRARKPTDEEIAALVAEAEELTDPETGDYRRANYSHVPRDIMEPYALEDVYLTRRVSDVYENTLREASDLAGIVEFERKAMDALYALEKRGLPVKDHGVEYRRLEQEVIANLSRLEDRVMELAAEGDPIVYAKELAGDKWGPDGVFIEQDEAGRITTYSGGAALLDDFKPNSTAQVLAALKARGADMSYMSVKDGKVSADADNLRAVDDALAAAILDFRAEYKVLSTYVRPMIGRSYVSAMNVYKEPFIAPDSRIHANYRQVGARTGRMSCSDPNMQNQPRDDLRLRYNIVADPGFKLVACDLTNIEMFLFAAYCGEGRLLDAVNSGEDLHALTAKMLGLRDRARPGGGVETARQLGKTYNFSRIYGGGLRTIRRSFRCSLDEARLLKKRFDDAYPEVARLTNRIQFRLEDDGYIQDQLFGRRFRVDPREAYKATNYLVQGTAASLLKDAVITLHADGVPMVALVHDEVVAHVPEDAAADVAQLIEKRMTQQAQPGGKLHGIIPLRAEADIIERWSDAKPLKDDTGKAYLFTPEWAGGERRYVAG